ncbi:isocitrate lyase/phosphoenolpyruvate mutase family protein [Bradyrhizobium sp. DASA03005]|uniref:isocitrate lyase/phosphoenolpyruvate mutase family protein n=1 Tax=Bradyrhizobium sp. SPXBL-02 TaxID=3395912 RepID=UPI003F6F1199
MSLPDLDGPGSGYAASNRWTHDDPDCGRHRHRLWQCHYVIHAIGEYERAGASAVLIEEKIFPKVTSLAADGRQKLLRIEEFRGKIEAALTARRDPNFLVIARTEVLIAGLGEAEAFRASICESWCGRDPGPGEIESFSRAWTGSVPLAILPNAYPDLDARRVKALGNVQMIIYGNYGIRASSTAFEGHLPPYHR